MSASQDELSWVQTSYLIAEILVIPMSGWLSRVFSTRWLFVASAVGFTATSMLCGMAWDIDSMILFRGMQGALGAAMIPTVFTTAFVLFPGKQRLIASTTIGVLASLAPAISPVIGGWITDQWSWHWLFYLNVVPGLVVALLVPKYAYRYARSLAPQKRRLFGIMLMSGFLGCLEYVLEEGPRKNWFGDDIIVTCAWICGICGFLFLVHALTAKEPIVDLRALAVRNFGIGSLLSFVIGIGIFTSVFLTPVFLARVRGFDSLHTGLALLSVGCFQLVSIGFYGVALRHIDMRILLVFGLVCLGLGCYFYTPLTHDWGWQEFLLPQALRGIGQQFAVPPIVTMALGSLPPSRLKSASGLFNLMRNLGGAIGIAVSATMLNDRLNLHYLRLNESVTLGSPAVEAMLSRSSAHLASVAGDARSARAYLRGLFLCARAVLSGRHRDGVFREADRQRAGSVGSALMDATNMKKFILEIAACLSMAACAVQPATYADLHGTVNDIASANWSVDVPNANAVADANTWWNQFNDPVMHRLVPSVLDSNLDIRQAVERVKQAQALTTQKRAALLPQLDANARAADTRQNTPPPLGYMRQVGIGLTLGWTPYALCLRRRAARTARRAGAVGRARTCGRSGAARARGEHGLGIYRSAMGSVGVEDPPRQRDHSRACAQAHATPPQYGLSTKLDIARAQNQLSDLQARIPRTQATIQHQLSLIAVYLGRTPELLDTLALADAGAAPVIPVPANGAPQTLPSDALLRRPDVLAAYARVEQRATEVGVARAERYPKFSLRLSDGLLASSYLGLPTLTDNLFSAALNATSPIFDVGRIGADIDRNESRMCESQLALRQTLLDALAASDQSLTLSTQLYKGGAASFLDVLDAQEAYLRDADSLNRSKREQALAAVALYRRATAGGRAIRHIEVGGPLAAFGVRFEIGGGEAMPCHRLANPVERRLRTPRDEGLSPRLQLFQLRLNVQCRHACVLGPIALTRLAGWSRRRRFRKAR